MNTTSPETVPDFIRNYLARKGMLKTFASFQVPPHSSCYLPDSGETEADLFNLFLNSWNGFRTRIQMLARMLVNNCQMSTKKSTICSGNGQTSSTRSTNSKN